MTDKRSAALHAEVARRVEAEPELLVRAQVRVAGWLDEPARHPYAHAWQELLHGDLGELRRALSSAEPGMCTLRQASPFAGVLDSQTRWRILKTPALP